MQESESLWGQKQAVGLFELIFTVPSSHAVLGRCQRPGTGSRELWGLLPGDLPKPLAVVLGTPLLWGVLLEQQGAEGYRGVPVPNYSGIL